MLVHLAVCLCVCMRSDLPYKIAAEYEAENEDKNACAEDNHIDIERQVLEADGWHSAGLIGVDQSQTAEAPYTRKYRGFRGSQVKSDH